MTPHNFVIQGHALSAKAVIKGLRPFLTEARIHRIETVVQQRISRVVPVLEGLYDRGNVSAVLRSAEGLGFGCVHVIDSSPFFKEAKRVTQGAEKWLDLQLWEETKPCLQHLKAAGYQILVTHLEGAKDLEEISFDSPTALIFGNEKEGVSPAAIAEADARVKIPMAGFSQSFNISVAAALFLYHIRQAHARTAGNTGDLTPEERDRLQAEYFLRSVPNAEGLLLRQLARSGGIQAE